jgi:hypothetical protein
MKHINTFFLQGHELGTFEKVPAIENIHWKEIKETHAYHTYTRTIEHSRITLTILDKAKSEAITLVLQCRDLSSVKQ